MLPSKVKEAILTGAVQPPPIARAGVITSSFLSPMLKLCEGKITGVGLHVSLLRCGF